MNDDLTKKLPSSTVQRRKASLTIMQNLESRFEALEKKVEERLYDTRPIWEKVLVDITQLKEGQAQLLEGQAQLHEGQARLQESYTQLLQGQAQLQGGQAELSASVKELGEGHTQLVVGQKQLQEGQEFLRGEIREIKTMLRDIFRRLSIFNDTLMTMQADYRDIYDRVRGLELNRNQS